MNVNEGILHLYSAFRDTQCTSQKHWRKHFNYDHCVGPPTVGDAMVAILYLYAHHALAKVVRGQERIHQLDLGVD